MPVKIKLIEGEELTLDVDAEEWASAFQRALSTGQVLQVEDQGRGRVLTINPQSVAYYYLEEALQESAPVEATPVRQPEPATS